MAESAASLALEKLDRILGDEVASLVGVTDEIERLSSTFTFIQAVLKDAEIQRSKDEAVKIWLEKLRGLAYDVDDILDEWMMEALKSHAPNEADGSCFSKKKVRSFLSPVTCFNHVVLRQKIGYRIKEAWERLAYIAEERSQLGLSEVRRGEIREGQTGFLLDRSSIVGREEDKNEVLNLLMREISGELNEVPFVISTVGMGGFGKTTLAQIAYNEKVKGHFEMRM